MIDWQIIIEKHGSVVWQTAYRLLGNDADASDCFQETFISALEFSRRQRVRNFSALLIRLATVRAIDQLRKRFHRSDNNVASADWVAVPSKNPGPVQMAQHQELITRLRESLAELPPAEAQVFCMRYLNDMSYRQIAKELGIKTNAAGVLLHRARAKLRKSFAVSTNEKKRGCIMKEKERENNLEKAVNALNNEQVPSGPSRELVNSTVAKLNEISGQASNFSNPSRIRVIDRISFPNSFAKVAAAAVLLIMAGYATGRLLSPKPPDIEQLQAALEPAIRQNLLDEMKQYWQLGLTASYAQLKDDLSQQYRNDLNQFAAYTLTASGAATNQLLEDLIESINQAQTQERQWFATALGEIELNRLQDNAKLSNALATFAVQTEDELMRTKQDMAQMLSYTQPDSLIPNRFTDPNN